MPRSVTGGSPWQNEKKNIPRNIFSGDTQILRVRCFSCGSVEISNPAGYLLEGDDYGFPCTNCGAILGPGGDHPGRKRVTSKFSARRRTSADKKSGSLYK